MVLCYGGAMILAYAAAYAENFRGRILYFPRSQNRDLGHPKSRDRICRGICRRFPQARSQKRNLGHPVGCLRWLVRGGLPLDVGGLEKLTQRLYGGLLLFGEGGGFFAGRLQAVFGLVELVNEALAGVVAFEGGQVFTSAAFIAGQGLGLLVELSEIVFHGGDGALCFEDGLELAGDGWSVFGKGFQGLSLVGVWVDVPVLKLRTLVGDEHGCRLVSRYGKAEAIERGRGFCRFALGRQGAVGAAWDFEDHGAIFRSGVGGYVADLGLNSVLFLQAAKGFDLDAAKLALGGILFWMNPDTDGLIDRVGEQSLF